MKKIRIVPENKQHPPSWADTTVYVIMVVVFFLAAAAFATLFISWLFNQFAS